MSDDPRSDSEVILYQTEDGKSRLQVRFSGETAWLSLNQLADFFQRNKSSSPAISKNIFQEEELEPDRVVEDFATAAVDEKTYEVSYPIQQQLLPNMQQFVEKDFEKAVKKLPKPKKAH